MDRREFLKTLVGTGLAVGVGSSLSSVLSGCSSSTSIPEETAQTPGESGIVVCHQNDLKPGESKPFKMKDAPALLIAQADGSYRAMSLVCTHMGCEVLYNNKDNSTLICPCHGGKFDLSGKVLEGPPPSPLPTFPVKVGSDGKVRVLG